MNLLCPPPNIIGGSEAIKEELAESQTINVNLHIGVFFDGTNNNKVQSMLALSDRRKKFYKRHKKELKNLKIANYEDMLKKDKKFFCDARIGTTNELDSIFGSSTNFDLFMEQIIATDNETIYRQATSADDYNEKSRIKHGGTLMSIDKTSYSAKEKAFSRLIKVYENGKFIEKEFLIPSESPCCGTDEYSSFSLTTFFTFSKSL